MNISKRLVDLDLNHPFPMTGHICYDHTKMDCIVLLYAWRIAMVEDGGHIFLFL